MAKLGSNEANRQLASWTDGRLSPPEPRRRKRKRYVDCYPDEDREATEEQYAAMDDAICRRIYGE